MKSLPPIDVSVLLSYLLRKNLKNFSITLSALSLIMISLLSLLDTHVCVNNPY